jgi:VWFA-related protein
MALALAQNPPARPQGAPALQPAPQPEDVIRINVNLVQVDALVTDAQGKLVEDLRKEDFEIRQDGKPQLITNFSYISTRPGQPAAPPPPPARGKKAAADPGAPPPVPLRASQARRTFALVVDDLALAAENVPAVRSALEKFVDQDMQPGDLAAVIRTGSGMGALEQFTTDKRVLHLAINRIHYNAFGRVGISSFGGGGGRAMGAQAQAERNSQLNAASIQAITNVVNGLRELPGRKTVVLFTESLQIMSGGAIDPRAQSELNRLTDAASRAAVVISSIDPRGLQTFALSAADHPRSAGAAMSIPMQRATRMFNSQDGMVLLARATGGTFTHDQNDIAAAVHRVVEDSNGYYLIGYHPAASTFDPKTGQFRFHNISVRVKRPGLQARTRAGFLGTPDAPQRVRDLTPHAELMHALTSPFGSRGLRVRMTALFGNSPKLGSSISALMYIDAKDLQFEDLPGGAHRAVMEVLSATFTENEKVENPLSKTFTITLKEDRYQQALRSGFTYTLSHPVKKPGGYQVRIAVRDANSLQIGSASQFIEVPDVSKGRLTLSSITLRDASGTMPPAGAPGAEPPPENPLGTAADRSFVPGEPVLYAIQILNARSGADKQPQLEIESRIFRDGVQINESKPRPADTAPQGDAAHLIAAGELRLGSKMKPGDYVLQLIVTDKLAAPEYHSASQWMDFEVR